MAYLNIGVDLGINSKSTAQVRKETGEVIIKSFSFNLTRKELDLLCKKAIEPNLPLKNYTKIKENALKYWIFEISNFFYM